VSAKPKTSITKKRGERLLPAAGMENTGVISKAMPSWKKVWGFTQGACAYSYRKAH
jgi:hypothetical protein